jgi:hypothetical protein
MSAEDTLISPLTREEFEQVKDVVSRVVDRLPEHDAPFIWTIFNKLRNATEPQPCTCASSGAHWGRAIGHLREWLSTRKDL